MGNISVHDDDDDDDDDAKMINLSFVLISDNHTCIFKCTNNPAWKTLIIFILRSRFRMDAKTPTLCAQK